MNNSAEMDSFDFGSYCSPRGSEEDTPKAPAILSDIVRNYINEEESKKQVTEETKRAQNSSSPQKRMSMGSRAQDFRGKRQSNQRVGSTAEFTVSSSQISFGPAHARKKVMT